MVGGVEMFSVVQPLVFGLSLILGEMEPLDCNVFGSVSWWWECEKGPGKDSPSGNVLK